MSQWDILDIFVKHPNKEFTAIEVEKITTVNNNVNYKLKQLVKFGYLDEQYKEAIKGKYPAYYKLRLGVNKK